MDKGKSREGKPLVERADQPSLGATETTGGIK